MLVTDRLERQVLADRQAAFGLVAAGKWDKDQPLPDVGVERARFDEALRSEPVPEKALTPAQREQQELRRALGVA